MITPAKFACAASLTVTALLPGLARAALPPAGTFYKLTIKTSFEPSFIDCWAFSSNGRFIVSKRLHHFGYQLTGLNTNAGHFQALWQGSNSIGFSGATSGTSIAGDAVDSVDRTYSFTGTQVSSCAGIPVQNTTTGGFLTH
jgi:hypothetical protein